MNIGARCNPLKLKDDFPALLAWMAANNFDSVDLMAVDEQTKKNVEQRDFSPTPFFTQMRGPYELQILRGRER